MQLLVQMQCLVTFTLGQLCDRNTRPAGNNTCDLFLTDVLMYQRKIFILNFLFLNFQLFLQLWKFSILQLCCFFQIIILLCGLDLILDLLDLFTKFLDFFNRFLFVFPLYFLCVKFITKFCQFLLKIRKTLLTQTIRLFFQSCLLNLHLHDTTV